MSEIDPSEPNLELVQLQVGLPRGTVREVEKAAEYLEMRRDKTLDSAIRLFALILESMKSGDKVYIGPSREDSREVIFGEGDLSLSGDGLDELLPDDGDLEI